VPSVHPRCSQHSLVAPDGMCVLCRKQASSGPPAAQTKSQPSAAESAARSESTDKFAALLVGVALVTMGTTYLLDRSKAKEIAESQRVEEAETARLQQWALAAARAEEQSTRAAPARPKPAADMVRHQNDEQEQETE